MRKMFFLIAALAACTNEPTAATDRVPRVGLYTYASPIGTGTLQITRATPDSVVAVWNVAGRDATFMAGYAQLGTWNEDAYVLWGTLRSAVTPASIPTTYVHRIARNGDAMTCEVQAVGSTAATGCTLVYAGR